jgi:hypothetical protein
VNSTPTPLPTDSPADVRASPSATSSGSAGEQGRDSQATRAAPSAEAASCFMILALGAYIRPVDRHSGF